MMNFSQRSYEKELLDGDVIPFKDIKINMQELEFINKHLGGHKITIKGFRDLLGDRKAVSVCEIGCGGGDNLRAIGVWCKKNDISVRFTGIDINKDCIAYARENCRDSGDMEFITSDYRSVVFGSEKPAIVFSSLFCHHLNDQQLKEMIKWLEENAEIGFFINDLQRHPVAYYSIKWLTSLFSNSYLVKNDAPLSVKRGFLKNDWEKLFAESGVKNYSIQWQWAFRWLVVVSRESGVGSRESGVGSRESGVGSRKF
jgi:ubiquinone/menaquinone biosynthesis C-methylase UbiE